MLSTSRSALLNKSLISGLHSLHNGKGRPESMIRKFSSHSTGTRNLALPARRPILLCKKIIPSISSRFLSSKTAYDPLLDRTAQSTPTPSQNATSDLTIKPEPASANAWDPNFVESSSVQESITPHIGYLHELGLNYGWGPTSLLQWFTEYIQVYSGLPWYAVIPLTAIAVRVCLLPLYIRAAVHSAKLQKVFPRIKLAQAKMSEAKARDDSHSVLQATMEMRNIKKAAGGKSLFVFLPILIQFPLAFGAFKFLRGMADIPVPGLQNGGIFWITDLTIPDPYYILPFATSAVMYFTMKFGSESGQHNQDVKQVMKVLPKFLAPISFVFTSFFPAALTVHFFTSSILAYCQTRLMQNSGFRTAMGIPPVIQTPPTPEAAGSQLRFVNTTINTAAAEEEGKKGYLGQMLDLQQQRETLKTSKSAMQRVMESNLGQSFDPKVSSAKRAKKKAEAYEKKRRAEIEAEKRQRRQPLSKKKSSEEI